MAPAVNYTDRFRYPIIVDISNYDYDADTRQLQWIEDFAIAGVYGVIVGSQWPSKSRSQLQQLQSKGMRIVGTYAEPDVESAIELALEFKCSDVGLACERGSILTHEELAQDITAVYNTGLIPWIYGNQGDLAAIAQNFLFTEQVWLANYGRDDPLSPRDPITELQLGGGTISIIAHQFSSTMPLAGRVRDHSYFYGAQGEEMSSSEYARVVRILTGYPPEAPQAEEQLSAWEAKGNSLLMGFAADQARTDKLEIAQAAAKNPAKVGGI